MKDILFEEAIKSYINEELGIADDVRNISDNIIMNIENKINNTPSVKDEKNNGVFIKNFNFKDKINEKNIIISVIYYNFLNKDVLNNIGNQYDIDYATSVCDGKGLNMMKIHCYAISGTLQKKSLYDQVYHEVNHIFQGNKGSKTITSFNLNYTTAMVNIYSENLIDRALANVVYLIYKFEQDGYINGLYGYLKNFGPIPEWKNIYKSGTYKAIIDLKNYISFIEININNNEVIDKAKKYYNATPQKLVKLGYKSIERMKRKISKILIKYRNDMMEEGLFFHMRNCKDKSNMFIF